MLKLEFTVVDKIWRFLFVDKEHTSCEFTVNPNICDIMKLESICQGVPTCVEIGNYFSIRSNGQVVEFISYRVYGYVKNPILNVTTKLEFCVEGIHNIIKEIREIQTQYEWGYDYF